MSGTTEENLKIVRENIKKVNTKAKIIEINSVITVENPQEIKNKSALLIGDGPTLTHGGMKHGVADYIAEKYKLNVVDAEKYAVGSIKQIYKKFPHLKKVLPAMGYSPSQMNELEMTINAADCDTVIAGTPIDLGRLLKLNKPVARVRYRIEEVDIKLEDVIHEWLNSKCLR